MNERVLNHKEIASRALRHQYSPHSQDGATMMKGLQQNGSTASSDHNEGIDELVKLAEVKKEDPESPHRVDAIGVELFQLFATECAVKAVMKEDC